MIWIFDRSVMNGLALIGPLVEYREETNIDIKIEIGQFMDIVCETSFFMAVPDVSNIVINIVANLNDRLESKVLSGFLNYIEDTRLFHETGDYVSAARRIEAGLEILKEAKVPDNAVNSDVLGIIDKDGNVKLPDRIKSMIDIKSESQWVADLNVDSSGTDLISVLLHIQSMTERLLKCSNYYEVFILYSLVFLLNQKIGNYSKALEMIATISQCLHNMHDLTGFLAVLSAGVDYEGSLPRPIIGFEERLVNTLDSLSEQGIDTHDDIIRRDSIKIINASIQNAKESDIRFPLLVEAINAVERMGVSIEFEKPVSEEVERDYET